MSRKKDWESWDATANIIGFGGLVDELLIGGKEDHTLPFRFQILAKLNAACTEKAIKRKDSKISSTEKAIKRESNKKKRLQNLIKGYTKAFELLNYYDVHCPCKAKNRIALEIRIEQGGFQEAKILRQS